MAVTQNQLASKTLNILLVTSISFGVYFVLDELYFGKLRQWLDRAIHQLGTSHILTYLIMGIPIYLGTLLMHRVKGALDSLGLTRSLLEGIIAPLIFTLPMFIGYAWVFEFNAEVTFDKVAVGVIAAAFFEELFFRGFLFGQLYRYTKIGFIPSILLGALLFASVHLYQSQEVSILVGIFGATFFGAVMFAWVYVEWGYNLWVPIFLHLFMNLSWMLFSVSDNAWGGNYANIFRVSTILLTVILTIVYKKRKGIRLEVNRRTIWMKKEVLQQSF
ncbi:MAG: lysostaphin resistance A-like protein [Cyclobacteriaceae bacterium]|mgnify:CR=1 FL=1